MTSALKVALENLAAASATVGSSSSVLGPPLAVLGPLPSGVLLQGGTGDVGSHGFDDESSSRYSG